MTDYIAKINEASENTELSRILSDHKPIIADYLLSFNEAWTHQQTEIAYLASRHPALRTKKIEQLIQQHSSTPSLESLRTINGLIEEINCIIVEKKIEAIGIHGTHLNLDNAYITRLPVSLFQKEGYVDFWKNLTTFTCQNNKLTTLDLSALTALEGLNCSDNQLIILDLSAQTALNILICSNNHLTFLNLKGLAALEILICNNNKLTALDVQDLTSLGKLCCENNLLTMLNLQELTQFYVLNCDNNPLEVLSLRDMASPAKNKYGLLEIKLKFEQLEKTDSDEARSIILESLGSDYTYENCLYYCPALIPQLFLSDAANKTQGLITSIFSTVASFLPSFSTNNNNQNQDVRKRARDENGTNIDLDESKKNTSHASKLKYTIN